MQNICARLLPVGFGAGILRGMDERGMVPTDQLEFDVLHFRAINGRNTKRQAIAMSLRVPSPVLGTSPAGCPISAPFGYEHEDWNRQSGIRVGRESP